MAQEKNIGLCARCVWARDVRTRRGSRFYRCSRSEQDATYDKYPRLPVLDCAGYAARPDEADAERSR